MRSASRVAVAGAGSLRRCTATIVAIETDVAVGESRAGGETGRAGVVAYPTLGTHHWGIGFAAAGAVAVACPQDVDLTGLGATRGCGRWVNADALAIAGSSATASSSKIRDTGHFHGATTSFCFLSCRKSSTHNRRCPSTERPVEGSPPSSLPTSPRWSSVPSCRRWSVRALWWYPTRPSPTSRIRSQLQAAR